jgi:ferric-dicitrate binding protein FerR (iron transport regulator)
MKKPVYTSIGYEYIWKKLNNCISEEEDKLLSDWLQESPENRQFYSNAQEFKSSKQENSTQEAWKKIEQRVKKQKRNRIIIYSSAACFALLITTFLFVDRKEKGKNRIVATSTVATSDVTTLVLSDGTNINLEQKNNITFKEAGATIEQKKKSLTYSAQTTKPNILTYNTIIVPRGEEFYLVLSDSTKVWINSETVLRYPVEFAQNKREIEIKGEAFFKVKKDKKRPFIVTSDNQRIEVTGTEFNVSSFGKENSIVTTLVEGSVQITANDHSGLSVGLESGTQCIFSKKNSQFIKRKVDVSLYTSWKDGSFCFQDEPLEDIMSTLSRWYNFNYVFKNDQYKSIRFTGRLKRTESIERILTLIEKTNEIQFKLDNNMVYVN